MQNTQNIAVDYTLDFKKFTHLCMFVIQNSDQSKMRNEY